MPELNNSRAKLVEALERITVHAHLCLIYETAAEQFAAIVPLMRIGLEGGERCLYLADNQTAVAVLEAMQAEGIDLEAARNSGALAILSPQEIYLKHGYFDPDEMIHFLIEATNAAKAAGFSALRIASEMTWMLGNGPDVERLIEYEAKLNTFLPENDILAICQYHRQRFNPEIILEVIRTHPLVIQGNVVCKNFHYIPPAELLGSNRAALEVERLLNNLHDHERVEQALRAGEQFNRAVLDSTPAQVVMLDKRGTIIQVNQAWERFAQENSETEPVNTGIGTNYLAVCWAVFGLSDVEASECLTGLHALLDGSINQFDFEYPCHSPTEERWFLMRAVPLHDRERGVVISHFNITQLKQAEKAVEQRNRDLALLNRSSQVFISTLDPNQVLTVILEEVRHLLAVLACSVWLIDPQTDELVCQQATDPHGKMVRGWRLKPGQGLAGWSAQHGRSLAVPDVLTDERHFKGVDQKTGLQVRSILTVPLWVKQQVIGVIQVVDTKVNRFNEMDVVLLESLAGTAAVAIENARLYEQARRDAETKAALLHEVNHRVKNNLAAIVSLLYAEQNYVDLEDQTIYQTILNGLVNRVQGLATVHDLLSASEWSPLRLSELARQVIRSSLQVLPRDKHISVEVSSSQVKVTADQAHNLALIINELVTNTMRHALTGRSTAHIAVGIRRKNGLIQVEFRDDGPGYPEEVLRLERHGVGFDLIQPLVYKSLRGQLSLHNDQGALTVIRFNANREANRGKVNQ